MGLIAMLSSVLLCLSCLHVAISSRHPLSEDKVSLHGINKQMLHIQTTLDVLTKANTNWPSNKTSILRGNLLNSQFTHHPILNFENGAKQKHVVRTFPENRTAGSWKLAAIWRGPADWYPIPNLKWQSDCGQDKTVTDILNSKKNGYFIDFAANDYQRMSNTAMLEQKYNWNGLCIEPQDKYWDNHIKHRRCTTVKAVVTENSNELVEFSIRPDNDCPGCSGIVGYDNKVTDKQHTYTKIQKFSTLAVTELFDFFDVPSTVDYLSLDIEGAEYETFKNFPFNKYKFMVISVERPRKLHDVLVRQGYVYLKNHCGGQIENGDKMYIHKTLPDFDKVMAKFFKK